MDKAPTIGIVGKGALGLLFADIATRTLGEDAVTFVMDEARYVFHSHTHYRVNGEERTFRTVPANEAEPVDLAILAVKSPQLVGALNVLEPLVGEGTCIISVLNGITSEERVAERYGWHRVCGAVAQGMDAMRFGSELTYAHPGEIRIGDLARSRGGEAVVERVDEVLSAAGIPHSVWDDIELRMWAKFMLNVGINQTCCVYGCAYGDVVGVPGSVRRTDRGEQFRTFVAAMREVVAVANAEGVGLTEAHLSEMVELVRGLDPDSIPSMAQDRVNEAYTEVETFAGELCRRAARHGILVPTNEHLYRSVCAIEASWDLEE